MNVNKASDNVNAYFDIESSSWNEIYHKKDVYSVIHQYRRSTSINLFENLMLPHESRILEIGCGAGLTAIDIAKRGYSVEAVDSTEAMVHLTRHNTIGSGLESKINANVGDIQKLRFADSCIDLVIALGVVPWIVDVNMALKEVSRVLAPGGYVIMNADNRYRLNHLLDPAHMPAFAGMKERLRKFSENAGFKKATRIPRTTMHTSAEFDNLLASAGLVKIKHRMIGFGPFTFLKIQLFPGAIGIWLHRLLQRAANLGFPILRSTGAQYLVVARKQ